MIGDWYHQFVDFYNLNLTRKELSKEFKILREAELVEFRNGIIEDGYAVGSGYCLLNYDEVARLLDEWEEKNLPIGKETIKETK